MDNCAKYQEMISALLDDELSPAEREALHAHMGSCPDCRRMYDAFAAISGAEELEEAPEGMLSGAMFRIRNPAPRKKKPVLWRRYAAAAACLVLVIFGATRLDFRMGANSAASADCAAPAAMDVYTMNSDNSMSYVADSAKAQGSEDTEMSVPADTSLPAETARPMPEAPQQADAEENAGDTAKSGLRLLRVMDDNGVVLYVTTEPAVLQELAPMLVSSGTGYCVTAEYTDGTTAEFILPVNAEELKTLLENLG